jgi:hypothetical protein
VALESAAAASSSWSNGGRQARVGGGGAHDGAGSPPVSLRRDGREAALFSVLFRVM